MCSGFPSAGLDLLFLMQIGFCWREGIIGGGGALVWELGRRGSVLRVNDLGMSSIGTIRCPIFGTIGRGDWEDYIERIDE